MEELSVEQKAKAYDESIIRNEIIAFLKEGKPYHCPNSVKRQEWAAWVEKHTDKPNNIYDKELSEILGCVIRRYINDPNISYTEREKVSKEIIPYVESLEKQGEHSNFLNKIQIGDKVTRNKDGVLVNLSQLNRLAKPTNEEQKDILEDAILDGNEDGLIAETIRYKKERQDEQKSADRVEPKFHVKEELKKIEEEFNGEDYGIDSLWHAQNILERTLGKVEGYQTDDGILEHKCAITAVKKLYEKKPTEWSEEEEKVINDIIRIIDGSGLVKSIREHYINKLKSLRHQTSWKPSKEQMEALLYEINAWDEGSINGQDLKSLYQDLKKLRKG